jgi:DNA-binding NtrC family response regulator
MRALRERVARLAVAEATVLITGATGTGKENVARALHAAGPRAGRRFEAVNCGAIPRELAEAELFGAEAGAYTGAGRARAGRIEAADGGTLFLDEVGELPPDLQVKLLRVLETREVERLGGGRPVPVDLRIVAATNVDLEEAVADGRFRADLYWRLAVVWLELPPLAERLEDIPALVQHFAARHRQRIALTPCGEAALGRHDWPGNLRELRNLVERALALDERLLDRAAIARLLQPRRRPVDAWLGQPGVVPPFAHGHAAPDTPLPYPRPAPRPASHRWAGERASARPLGPLPLRHLLLEAEAALIVQALEAGGGSVAGSARLLGLKRTTLVEKMKRMGLKPPANEAA